MGYRCLIRTAPNRPDFAALLYAYMNALEKSNRTADAPPLFIWQQRMISFVLRSIAAIYKPWIAAKKEAELHMYVKAVMVLVCANWIFPRRHG
jgi:hypothetical protein